MNVEAYLTSVVVYDCDVKRVAVAPPEDELIAFHLTDRGRDRIRAWCGSIRDVRDTPGGRAVWHAVTGR